MQERRNAIAKQAESITKSARQGQEAMQNLLQSVESNLDLAKHAETWKWKETTPSSLIPHAAADGRAFNAACQRLRLARSGGIARRAGRAKSSATSPVMSATVKRSPAMNGRWSMEEFESESAARRYARVNTISPGIVITPLAKDELAGPRGEGYRRMIELCPVGRAATPDEVGAVGALLMGPDGAFITGSDFLMDGGVTASYAASSTPSMSCAASKKDSVSKRQFDATRC